MEGLNEEKIKELKLEANSIRQSIIKMLREAGSGHTAGPLGMTDIFTLLFFHVLKHKPQDPNWADRDILVLSNGHICPVYYTTLAHVGYFDKEELLTLRKFGTRLQGHPHREFLPLLETSSGPLGAGLSQAVGMALADRMDSNDKKRNIFCLMSDGELNEGNSWEGIMLAGKEKLSNLIAIVDRNNIQIDGNTEDIMPLEPLADKWRSFNWNVYEADGHNLNEINEAILKIKNSDVGPSVILAKTIPGKGVSFIEGDYRWHGDPLGKKDVAGDPPKDEQVEMALGELIKEQEILKNA